MSCGLGVANVGAVAVAEDTVTVVTRSAALVSVEPYDEQVRASVSSLS